MSGAPWKRPPPLKLTQPVVREHPIQRDIVKVLTMELAAPGKVSRGGVVWWAVDHANYGGEIPGTRIGRGIIAGIPDLFILHAGRGYFIEIKAVDGSVSEPQRAVLLAVLAAGGRCGVACSYSDTLRLLDGWGIPRAGRVHA